MGATGTAIIDFGPYPGANEASVAVTGQAAILITSKAEAFVMLQASADHTANDHAYLDLVAAFPCSVPTAGVGFTIEGRSEQKLTGQWNLRWVWAD